MMPIGNTHCHTRVTGLALLLCAVLAATAWGDYHATFEGSETSWRAASADVGYRIADHRRVRDLQHSGAGCEMIGLVAGAGTAIYFQNSVPHARVIHELEPSVWVRCDRPGIQLLARVVLPRTKDPRNGQPLTTIVGGPVTTRSGAWERLRLQRIPLLLDRQVRVLRSQLGYQIDSGEAFVDQIILNLFVGPGQATVWIDDLELTGDVEPADREATVGRGDAVQVGAVAERLPPTAGVRAGRAPQEVRLQGTVMMIGSRPMLTRAITYQGEPLGFLKRLGFNAVRIASTPSPALLDEAARQGMWIIAAPPEPAEIEREGIGDRFRQVLAWDMGSGLAGSQRETIARWAHALKRSDPRPQRPLLGECKTDQRAFSRMLSVLVTGRAALGTSLELAGFARWMAGQSRLAVPGTPIWARIQTQPQPALREQLQILAPASNSTIGVGPHEISRLVWISLSAGARGLLFDSASPLTGTDAATRHRAEALELLNLQLSLLEPWLASATVVSSVGSSDPSVTGVLLYARAERARLLLPVHWQRGGQCVTGPPETEPVAVVVPGVPEPNRAYEVSLGGLRLLRRARVAGGIRVWLEQVDAASVVLMTQDDLVLSSISQRVAQTAPRASQLMAGLVTAELQQVALIDRRLALREDPIRAQIAGLLATARADLEQSHVLRGSGKYQRAYNQARRARHALTRVMRIHYEQVVGADTSPVASPLQLTHATLPEQQTFATRLRASRVAANQLIDGDFEDLAKMRQAGWQHFQHAAEGLRGTVELSPAEPHSGRFSLRLHVSANDPKTSPNVVAAPPLWITSPPVRVSAGQLIQIHAWVRVEMREPEPVDGLLVIDSLTGAALAERIGTTAGWREITLYRVVPPSSSSLSVTFALSSYGQADIDGLTIAPVALSSVGQPIPPAPHTAGPVRLPVVR
jgi:hypothetical protein